MPVPFVLGKGRRAPRGWELAVSGSFLLELAECLSTCSRRGMCMSPFVLDEGQQGTASWQARLTWQGWGGGVVEAASGVASGDAWITGMCSVCG